MHLALKMVGSLAPARHQVSPFEVHHLSWLSQLHKSSLCNAFGGRPLRSGDSLKDAIMDRGGHEELVSSNSNGLGFAMRSSRILGLFHKTVTTLEPPTTGLAPCLNHPALHKMIEVPPPACTTTALSTVGSTTQNSPPEAPTSKQEKIRTQESPTVD